MNITTRHKLAGFNEGFAEQLASKIDAAEHRPVDGSSQVGAVLTSFVDQSSYRLTEDKIASELKVSPSDLDLALRASELLGVVILEQTGSDLEVVLTDSGLQMLSDLGLADKGDELPLLASQINSGLR